VPLGFANGRLDDARLVLTEIVVNAVRHAGWSDAGGEIIVRIDAGEAGLRVEVEQPTTAVGVHELGQPGGAGPGGFGLHIVSRIADDWGHHDGPPGIVWFELQPLEV
jgi:anti-sigma regulatory factor (Ser/Thr protein kinase)